MGSLPMEGISILAILGGFSCFLNLIFCFPEIVDGLGTFGSVWKLSDPFSGFLRGLPIEFGLEKTFFKRFFAF